MNKVRFGDVLYIKGRIGWQALGKDEYLSTGDYYLVTGVDITEQNRINFRQCYYVTKERYDMDPNIQLKNGDIIVTKDGTIGKIGIIENLDKPATLNSHLFLIRNLRPDLLDNGFLFYILKSDYFQKFATNNTSGSNIPAFTQANIQKFTIDLPPLEKQRLIAKIAEDIDTKIRNNISICSELESMAKLLYNYWFIQFDFPDNDKPYKSNGGKLVYDNLLKREIPDGWKVAKIKNVISHINTGLNPRQNFILNNGSIKYITVKNLTTSGSIDFTTCDTINEEALEKVHKRSDISKGDILFASIAPLGRCVIIREDPNGWDINESVFSIRPKTNNLSEYLYMFFMSESFIKKAEQSSTGSVFSGIRISTLENMKVVVPPGSILDKFNKTISPILDLKYQKEMENQKLAETRDYILPLLMNGQIRIGD